MEALHCRANIEQLLNDEAEALLQLESLLGQEHELLIKNDIDGLERAGAARQQCVASLVRIEGERRSLCRALGRADDLKGLEGLMQWCDPTGSLKSRWAECAKLAIRSREQNDRNGMLVGARLKRIETMLGALGGGREPRLYSAQGSTSASRAGRTLTAHA